MSSGENERLAGRYRVVRQLGRGGMGVVWCAVDEVLGREVAVKELRTYNDSSGPELADLRLRMQREARAAARVRHPGVIAVHDVTEHQGRPVIVMELVDGPSLDGVLSERGVLDPREAAGIGAAVLEALAAAHDVGVLHRDVKPGNVLLDRSGRVVLTDFGIAAMDDPGDGSTTRLTRSGEIVGSLDYLAPERAQGQQPGPASDVWALGATLYAAVEGASPFRRTSTWSTLNAIVVEPLPEPRRAGALAPVLRQLMDKDPARRPDARTAARLLTAVAQGEGADGTAASGPVPVAGPVPTSGGVPVAGPVPTSGGVPVAGPVPTEPNVVPHRPEGFGPALPHPADGFGPVVPPAPASPSRAVGRKRSMVPVAAAVAAVVLVGGGVTYSLVGRGGDGTERQRLAGDQASPSSPGASPGRVIEPGGVGSGTPSAGPSKAAGKKSATPSPSGASKAPLPGGGGADGGATTGGNASGGGTTTGGGGTNGGTSGTGGASRGTSAGSTTTGGGGSAPQPAPVCHSRGGGKYDCEVWRTEKTYRHDGASAGVLNAGTNYFYCQADLGRRETSGSWTNVWWAKTDDDSGNRDVYFSVVYIKGGDNDAPLPGLPTC